jgi:hypothetical protein
VKVGGKDEYVRNPKLIAEEAKEDLKRLRDRGGKVN